MAVAGAGYGETASGRDGDAAKGLVGRKTRRVGDVAASWVSRAGFERCCELTIMGACLGNDR
jgi:hypothetical protein